MILKEDPDTIQIPGGNQYSFSDKHSITFGVVSSRPEKWLTAGELLTATGGSTMAVDIMVPRLFGSITHDKLPYLANEEWSMLAIRTAAYVKEAYFNLEIGKIPDSGITKTIKLRLSVRDYDGVGVPVGTMALLRLRADGVLLPEGDLEAASNLLKEKDLDALVRASSNLPKVSFDRYDDFSIAGRAWPLRDTFYVSFWGTPSSDAMKRIAEEIARKYGIRSKILVQNDLNDYDEWTSVGVSGRVLGDDVLREISDLSSKLHTATPEEKAIPEA